MIERLYKFNDFAKLVGVSRSAVIKLIREGKIRAINIHGRWYVPETELDILTGSS